VTYPEPRRVPITYADTRRLTLLERARACVLAGVDEDDLGPLLEATAKRHATPEQALLATRCFYAIAYELELRLDRSISWEEAQTWDVVLDLTAPADPIAEAEARTSIEASLATGLPPAVAGDLTLAQLDAYGRIRADAAKGRRTRRARVRR
jgi:hypothetical protein